MALTPHEQAFLEVVQATALEVLQQGKQMGYGMAMLEIKFTDGVPVIVVKSYTNHLKFQDNESAINAVDSMLSESVQQGYLGARTFTVVFDKKGINRVLGDNYQNHILTDSNYA